MAPTCPHPAPLARRAVQRQNPREEPSALAVHAGICAGGAWRRGSLPRSRIDLRFHGPFVFVDARRRHVVDCGAFSFRCGCFGYPGQGATADQGARAQETKMSRTAQLAPASHHLGLPTFAALRAIACCIKRIRRP
jgi:hypothetical protein